MTEVKKRPAPFPAVQALRESGKKDRSDSWTPIEVPGRGVFYVAAPCKRGGMAKFQQAYGPCHGGGVGQGFTHRDSCQGLLTYKVSDCEAKNFLKGLCNAKTLAERFSTLDHRDDLVFLGRSLYGNTYVHWLCKAADGSLEDLAQKWDNSLYQKEDKRIFLRAAFLQIAHQLNRMHSFGLMHRDVKPSNIVWTKEGEVSLIDFLSTRGVSYLSDYSDVTDTINKLPPETFLPKAPFEPLKSEVWALGMTVLDLFADKQEVFKSEEIGLGVPKVFSKQKELMKAIHDYFVLGKSAAVISGEYAPILEAFNRVDPLVSRFVCTKMLAFEPKNRPSMSEVVEFLEKNAAVDRDFPLATLFSCLDGPSSRRSLFA